jgi:Sulfate permease family
LLLVAARVNAAIVTPLAAGDLQLYTSLAVSLAVLTGVVCVIAGLFRPGFLADFLGKPVLVGFMKGIADPAHPGVPVPVSLPELHSASPPCFLCCDT